MQRQNTRMLPIALGLAIFLPALLSHSAAAQSDDCSKFTVAVRVWEIYDYPDYEDRGIGSVYDELNRREFKQKEDWLAEIEATVLAELKKHSPSVQFILHGTDCDYHFKFIICNYPVLYEWPDSIGGGPDIEVAGFLMMSCFGTERSCIGYNPRIVLCNSDRTSAHREISEAIKGNIAYYGNIEPRLEKWEKRFPAPARGPKIDRSHDRDYVSPLEGETELNIRVQVTNCKGEPVFDRFHRQQKVLYQKRTKRAELTADEDFNYYDLVDDNLSTGDYLVMGIYQPKGVSARYTLQRGIEAGVDSVEIKTCGRDRDDVDTAFVEVMGLDLRVSPRRRELFSTESTQIDIDFNRIDTKGAKIPIDGKTIEIKVRGLVDGKVIPKGNVVTNSQGRATLTYTAGQQDEEVTFEAKFQPKKFKEFVTDKAKVKVIKFDRLCQITRKSSHTTNITKEEHNSLSMMNWTETSEITVSMTFEENPTVGIAFDPATMQMKPSRYEYVLADYWISSSYHTGSGSREETVGSGAYIQRHLSASSGQNGTFQNLRPSSKDTRLVITVDPATGKATEVSLPGLGATISILSEQDCDGEKRVDGKLEPFDCSSTNQFTTGFSVRPFREECLEISGGDGIKVIRGQCHENKPTSQGSKEESFEWVIYVKD